MAEAFSFAKCQEEKEHSTWWRSDWPERARAHIFLFCLLFHQSFYQITVKECPLIFIWTLYWKNRNTVWCKIKTNWVILLKKVYIFDSYFWDNLLLVTNCGYEPPLRKIARFSGLLLFGFCLIDLCNHRLSLFCYKMNIKWNQARIYASLLWIKYNLPACKKIYLPLTRYLFFGVCFIDLCNHTLFAIKWTMNLKAEIREICIVIVGLLLIKYN